MKTEFKAKFLQHLNQKKQDQGFTLIELLVVVIIIGILAAIALPSLLSQTNKAKQAEARQNVGAMNRAQQAFFLERNNFTTDPNELGVGIKSQTTNFRYTISGTTNTVISNRAEGIGAVTLKSYSGAVGTLLSGTGSGTEVLTQALLCESNNPTNVALTLANIDDCPANWKNLGK
ncbi:MAG: prepilin-type N-terminal cleavage/methylation domain-containing protein [Microcoleus vaginatus WJT46-NPBG5]|jgi:type IV pilus assembly protein PilA|nr:prepilin-type N-terminal cleavage/methylation domain-containing protein [Microcoleus vaginatus WJT46-NPBG5]